MVLPITAKVNKKGHLEIGGCDTLDLAKEFGTPLFVKDETTIRHQCRAYIEAFQKELDNFEVIYAGKAFLSLAVCQIIAEESLSLDVSSGGELYLALKANFPTNRVYLHGNNKTYQELELALDHDIGCIVADSLGELKDLEQLAEKKRKNPHLFLRLTPGIKALTHRYIQTGQEDSKFGFGIFDDIAMKAVEKVLASPWLRLTGFHAHIGSQIFATESFAKAVEVIMEFVKKVRERTGFEASEVNIGGGLGIKYQEKDEPSSIKEYAREIATQVKKGCKKWGLMIPRIMVEPGRSIIGNAGVTLYTIGTIKSIPGIRTYISIDGGMSDNLRPMLYGARYEALIANNANKDPEVMVTIAGKHCESGDILIRDVMLPELKLGDILCTPATGAYGYVMANNYNKQPRPAVVLVKEGQAKLMVRRETYDDLLSLEEPLAD